MERQHHRRFSSSLLLSKKVEQKKLGEEQNAGGYPSRLEFQNQAIAAEATLFRDGKGQLLVSSNAVVERGSLNDRCIY